MVRKHYWASALMFITAVGSAGTAIVPSTSTDLLGDGYNTVQQAQHRGSGRLTQSALATDGLGIERVSLGVPHAQSHRGSGRLTAQAIDSKAIMAWRGSGRISAADATELV